MSQYRLAGVLMVRRVATPCVTQVESYVHVCI